MVHYSEREIAYGWCAGGRPSTLDSCARNWCQKGGGTDCRAVVRCGNGWGAIARPQAPARGISIVCGMSNAAAVRLYTLFQCTVAANTLCHVDVSFRGNGKRTSQDDNRAFERTFAIQTLLRTLSVPGAGALDGKYGPKTKAAIVKFQAMVGLPEDGQATDALLGALIEATGGQAHLVATMGDFFTEGWAKDHPIPAGYGYVKMVTTVPRRPFHEVIGDLPQDQRLARLSIMVRARDLPCATPAVGAERNGTVWTVRCRSRDYRIEQADNGQTTIRYHIGDEGRTPADSEVKATEDLLNELFVGTTLASMADDWIEEDQLKAYVEQIHARASATDLAACGEIEARIPALSGDAPPAVRLTGLYDAADRELRAYLEKQSDEAVTDRELIAILQRYSDCAFLARFEKRPWAALFNIMMLAEQVPFLGLYPSVILSSGELGVTDFKRVRLYAERAKDDPNPDADWSRKILPLFIDLSLK
ncbi:peptidoglycan-binding protein [Acuticoccus kandeliae]|uniref:peptidoglycan-binding protein n=1 Tax=Acuticoccus kandeliae TaxID=2073160 RepID=UPI00196A440F|nr:peptidoglycan-binding protein [Acuticoccus kandeliae]